MKHAATLVLALACPALAVPPTPAPTAAPAAPVSLSPASSTQGNDLSSVAGKIKLNRSGAAKGSFSVVNGTAAPAAPSDSRALQDLSSAHAAAAKVAQERMNRAVENGRWTSANIHLLTGVRNAARAEWDDAAENCRKTPGCKPTYRSDGVSKELKTDRELLHDVAKAAGLSESSKSE
jgi:hypothetical protein